MRRHFIILILLSLTQNIFAQNLNLAWEREIIADSGGLSSVASSHIATDQNDNIYQLFINRKSADFDPGIGITQHVGKGIVLNKYDKNGILLWSNAWKHNKGNRTLSFQVDHNNDIVMAGMIDSITDIDPGPGTLLFDPLQGNAYIMKLNSNGSMLWAKQIGSDSTEVWNVMVDKSNNIIIVGTNQNIGDFDPGLGTFFLCQNSWFSSIHVKYDKNGNFIWGQELKETLSGAALSSGIITDSSANIFIAGCFRETVDFDPSTSVFNMTASNMGQSDYVIKLDSNGNFIWAKMMETRTVDGHYVELAIDKKGDVYIYSLFTQTCDFNPNAGVYNMTNTTTLITNTPYLCKWDNNGNFIWAIKFQLQNNSFSPWNSIKGLHVDMDTNIYISIYSADSTDIDPGPNVLMTNQGQESFLKLDKNGDLLWHMTLDSAMIGNFIPISNGGLLCTANLFGITDVDPSPATFFTSNNLGLKTGNVLFKLYGNPLYIKNDFTLNRELKLFPNPAKNFIAISQEGEISIEDIKIYNLNGSLLHCPLLRKNTFDISQLANGYYVLKYNSLEYKEGSTLFFKNDD